ncbi:hypothetical protein BDN72DRAFT_419925 [Pluteus cervinus]|uniref:Uncharacterized protein n=1 Tax=Pluteus cervinus TaxID=181527 RepID=A0ACD3A849_9AGAR|nr:hypothetical protein BDN72DRAFT_419925 [Pluteus cervinus]
MTSYGMAYFLEDKTGLLTGSEYTDIHDRMKLVYRCTAKDSTHTAYMIYNLSDTSTSRGSSTRPVIALDFGAGNSLGVISFGLGSGSGEELKQVQMKKYLTKLSTLGSSKVRKFTGANGKEYTWRWKVKEDQEWACTDAEGTLIAYYSLKLAGEPDYPHSSGCMLTVEEPYADLASEMLASLMIMRHIAAHNL